MALATTSKKLRIIRLEIQWAGPGAVQEKTQLSQNARLNPSLVEHHLSTVDLLPREGTGSGSPVDLTNLHVLPSLLDNSGKNTASPMVIAIRPSTDSFPNTETILDRWEAIEERENLHSSFEQLGTRRNSVSSELPSVTRLQQLDPIVINKVVVGFQTSNFGKVLVLTMADGSVEYRDRFTFEPLYTSEDTEKVVNLRQAGWVFPEESPCKLLRIQYSNPSNSLARF